MDSVNNGWRHDSISLLHEKKSKSLMQELKWNSSGPPLYKSSDLSIVMALSEAHRFKEAEINE